MARKSTEDRTLEQVKTIAADIKVLQDHGEGCGCWECGRANATIASAPAKVVSTVIGITK